METQTLEKQSSVSYFLNSLAHTSKLMNMDLSMTPWYSTTLALTKALVSSSTNVEVWLTQETSLDSFATLNLFCVVLPSNVDEQRWEIKVPMKELLELIQLLPLPTLIEAMRSYSPIKQYKDAHSTFTLFKGFHITTSKKKYNYFGPSTLTICPQGKRNLNELSLSALYNIIRRETFKHWIVEDEYIDQFISNECGYIICMCLCESSRKHWHIVCTVLPSTVRGLQKIRHTYFPKIKPRAHPIQGFKIECINHFKNLYHYVMNNNGGHAEAQNLGKEQGKQSHKHVCCSSGFSGILSNNKALTDYGFNHDLETCSCNWAKKQRFYAAMVKAPNKTFNEERCKWITMVQILNKDYTLNNCSPNWELNNIIKKRKDLDMKILFKNNKL
jgi:hypothetical protein